MSVNIYFVRHGQSRANAAKIMQGSKIDTPLTALGRKQAAQTGQKLSAIKFDHVYASTLLRAGETAAIITANKVPITFDKRLVEFDYGLWDGKKIPYLLSTYPEYFSDLDCFLSSAWKVSQGETFADLTQRMASFTSELNLNTNSNLLVVSHEMTIKLWVSSLLKLPSPKLLGSLDNAGITQITYLSPDNYRLSCYNK